MCLVPDAPQSKVVESTDARAAAAADAVAQNRKSAQGFSSSIFGGMNQGAQPSVARQMLGMG